MRDWNTFIFSDQLFEEKTWAVFEYQYKTNPFYRRFCDALEEESESIWNDIRQIPLLPIRSFKEAKIFSGNEQKYDLKFQSSGTEGMNASRHFVAKAEFYRRSVLKGFSQFYNLDNAVVLCYAPGYAENPHSSLIWMMNELIKQDDIKKSRFLPLGKPLSQGEVDDIATSGRQLILFGAAFGLLDMVEQSSVKLPSNSIVIETGGMKTYRREVGRQVMHCTLARTFNIDRSRIHSEYGMCELLSQAYATGGKWFKTVPWMKVSIHDPDDPQRQLPAFQEGLIGVIDLANVYSCSFILTGDRGVMDRDERFQVLGRWNPTNLRGCNFLIDED